MRSSERSGSFKKRRRVKVRRWVRKRRVSPKHALPVPPSPPKRLEPPPAPAPPPPRVPSFSSTWTVPPPPPPVRPGDHCRLLLPPTVVSHFKRPPPPPPPPRLSKDPRTAPCRQNRFAISTSGEGSSCEDESKQTERRCACTAKCCWVCSAVPHMFLCHDTLL